VIRERGIQVPLDVTAAGVVMDGHQRLRAAITLGLSEVPVRVVTPEDEVEYLMLAALRRRHLSASQQAAVAIEIGVHREARAEAEQRRLANLKQNRSEVAALPPRAKTRELIAEIAGVSPRTVQNALTVRDNDPLLFRQVLEGTLAADKAARQVCRRRRDEGIDPPPPLPAGVFDLIYGDPPWRLGATDTERGPDGHYPTMTVEEIAALKIPAAKDAVLFLWAVDSRLPEALHVMKAWGFSYESSFLWVKDRIGLGAWNRNQHEQLLVGTRGAFSPPPPDLRVSSVIEAKRGRHSEKPAVVYERLEWMYPHATKLELFARTTRLGWTAWGNEVPDA
jgi:N6-adenosine-specific RNA methylase IME4